jgi:hypothetical protein
VRARNVQLQPSVDCKHFTVGIVYKINLYRVSYHTIGSQTLDNEDEGDEIEDDESRLKTMLEVLGDNELDDLRLAAKQRSSSPDLTIPSTAGPSSILSAAHLAGKRRLDTLESSETSRGKSTTARLTPPPNKRRNLGLVKAEVNQRKKEFLGMDGARRLGNAPKSSTQQGPSVSALTTGMPLSEAENKGEHTNTSSESWTCSICTL